MVTCLGSTPDTADLMQTPLHLPPPLPLRLPLPLPVYEWASEVGRGYITAKTRLLQL